MVSANTATSPYPLYPLGCSMVSAAIAGAGHDVMQFDYLVSEQSLDSFADTVREFAPDVIGISMRNIDNVNAMNAVHYAHDVRDLVAKAREASRAIVVLGGAGFSLMPEEVMDFTGADYGIAGEGEARMVKFLSDLQSGKRPATRVIEREMRLANDEIPSALYDPRLMDFYLKKGNIISVQTKRGCTHHCVYCTYPALEGSSIRQRTASSVVDDIELLRDKHGAKYVFFIDSVFNDTEGVYMELLHEMERRGVSVPWTGFFRPSGLDEPTVELMKRTGLVAAEVGADAASDATLKKMGKSFTFDDVRRCNELLHSHGVSCANFYIFGGPGETKETVREGIANILSVPNAVHFMFLGIRILPDTALHRIAIREGIVREGEKLLDSVFYFSPEVEREWMERELTEAFAGKRNCIFPPDSSDDKLRILHQLGYAGPMWEMLLAAKKKRGKA